MLRRHRRTQPPTSRANARARESDRNRRPRCSVTASARSRSFCGQPRSAEVAPWPGLEQRLLGTSLEHDPATAYPPVEKIGELDAPSLSGVQVAYERREEYIGSRLHRVEYVRMKP